MVLNVTSDAEEDLPRVREFVKEKSAAQTILWDDGGEASAGARYDISAIPVTLVIDRTGKVVRWPAPEGEMIGEDRHVGFRAGDQRQLDALVASVLAEKK